MRRPLLFAVIVLAVVLTLSGIVFEYLFITLPGTPQQRMDNAFVMGWLFDAVLISLAAAAIILPFARRVRFLQAVVQRQRAGETQARAQMSGSDFLAELGQAFDDFADANAQHMDNQRALLRAVSHELRTPVSRLRFALAELVSAEHDRRVELREQAEEDIEELDGLIGEVLAFVRVGPGGEPRTLQRFDLVALLQATPRDAAPRVHITAPKTLEIEGEPHLVQRAVSNLVRNAVRHAHHEVHITVEDADPVCITVEDDGDGLPSTADDRIFQPFVKLGDHPGGTGLGLSIAHAIAKRHGGHLTFEKRAPHTGAAFHLELPQTQSENAAS